GNEPTDYRPGDRVCGGVMHRDGGLVRNHPNADTFRPSHERNLEGLVSVEVYGVTEPKLVAHCCYCKGWPVGSTEAAIAPVAMHEILRLWEPQEISFFNPDGVRGF